LIMVVITVVCVSAAGFIIFRSTAPKNKLSEFAGQQTWVLCVNPKCKATYQTDLKAYYEEMEKKGPFHMEMEGVKCQKCGQLTAFKAIECPQCKNIFRPGSAGREDFHDRCPKCKYSKTEQNQH